MVLDGDEENRYSICVLVDLGQCICLHITKSVELRYVVYFLFNPISPAISGVVGGPFF